MTMEVMNNIVALNFEQSDVRIVHKDGEPWFVAKDVCGVLGLQGKGSDNIRPLDEDERSATVLHTPGGPQDVAIISEPGLYAILARSRKPIAKKFDRWVRHEVLPALRKDGLYSMHGEGDPLLARIVAVMEQNATTMEQNATTMSVLSEHSVRHDKKLDDFECKVTSRFALLDAKVVDIQSRLPATRRIKKSDRDWVIDMAGKMDGIDPLDPTKSLFDGAGNFTGEIDHFDDNPHNNKRPNLWPLHKDTHRRKSNGEFSKKEVRDAAATWHAKAKRLEPAQYGLSFGNE